MKPTGPSQSTSRQVPIYLAAAKRQVGPIRGGRLTQYLMLSIICAEVLFAVCYRAILKRGGSIFVFYLCYCRDSNLLTFISTLIGLFLLSYKTLHECFN